MDKNMWNNSAWVAHVTSKNSIWFHCTHGIAEGKIGAIINNAETKKEGGRNIVVGADIH
jgi:hypothetical protein